MNMIQRSAAFAAMAILLGGCGAIHTAQAPSPLLSSDETTQLQADAGYHPGLHLPPGPIGIGRLQMMTPLHGWALGPPGKGQTGSFYALLATVDGGTHWRNVTPPEIIGFVDKAVFFLDRQHAWVAVTPHIVSQPSPTTLTVFRTVDGAATWQSTTFHLSEGSPSQLDFVDALRGWMVLQIDQGYAIYRTSDGGLTWQLATSMHYQQNPGQAPAGGLPLDYRLGLGAAGCSVDPNNLVSFRDASVGWATGDCAKSSPYFFRTDDGGRSWRRQALPDETAYSSACQCDVWTSPPLFSSPADGTFMMTASATTCWGDAQGNDNCAEHLTRAFLYVTHDGGSTWTPHALPEAGVLARPPVFINASSGWFVVYKGANLPIVDKLYVTHDGGLTWTAMAASAQVGTLDFVSDQVGWGFDMFAQPSPTLFATEDGGRTWQALNTQLVN